MHALTTPLTQPELLIASSDFASFDSEELTSSYRYIPGDSIDMRIVQTLEGGE